MKLYLSSELYVNSIKTTPILGVVSRVRAKVELVVNQEIRIGGIALAYGKYGYYLSFPVKKVIAPVIYFSSYKTRTRLLKEIVTVYKNHKKELDALQN